MTKKFHKRIEITSDGCWLWLGRLNLYGYGPHRAIYERLIGKVPSYFHLHHECRNKRCVNPMHLMLVTPAKHHEIHDFFRRIDFMERVWSKIPKEETNVAADAKEIEKPH